MLFGCNECGWLWSPEGMRLVERDRALLECVDGFRNVRAALLESVAAGDHSASSSAAAIAARAASDAADARSKADAAGACAGQVLFAEQKEAILFARAVQRLSETDARWQASPQQLRPLQHSQQRRLAGPHSDPRRPRSSLSIPRRAASQPCLVGSDAGLELPPLRVDPGARRPDHLVPERVLERARRLQQSTSAGRRAAEQRPTTAHLARRLQSRAHLYMTR
jgi:hypothetical protein